MYAEFKGAGKFREGEVKEIVQSFKPWYDGYCFAEDSIGVESVYNSDMVLYHLSSMVTKGCPPENMVDANISTDYDKLQLIADIQRQLGGINVWPTVAELVEGMPFEISNTIDIDSITRVELFPTLLFNAGIIVPVRYYHGLIYYTFPNIVASIVYLSLINGWNLKDQFQVELKYSKKDATDEEIAALYDEAVLQLTRYRADSKVPSLAEGTILHQIAYVFRGMELVRLEQIAEEQM